MKRQIKEKDKFVRAKAEVMLEQSNYGSIRVKKKKEDFFFLNKEHSFCFVLTTKYVLCYLTLLSKVYENI